MNWSPTPGAEEESRRNLGRPLTRDEFEGVVKRYPGDFLP